MKKVFKGKGAEISEEIKRFLTSHQFYDEQGISKKLEIIIEVILKE